MTFDTSVVTGLSGLLRLRMWIDGGNGGIGTFDPEQDGWASYDYPLQSGGKPVVELTASPDVADDKNPGSANRATIRVRRSFLGVDPFTVNLSLRVGNMVRPGTTQDLAAVYGTTGNADYYIISGTGTWVAGTGSPVTTGTITFPTGQLEATVVVVPRSDNLTEQNFIDCNLEASPTGGYAPGASTRARVLIYDGPLWTAFELTGLYGPVTNNSTVITAVNSGVPGGTGWTVHPQAVGRIVWPDNGGTSYEHGALWSPHGAPSVDFGIIFRPNGISHRATASAKAGVVGTYGSAAYGILSDGAGGAALPSPGGMSTPSAALGISPGGSTFVGSATWYGSGGVNWGKPVKWTKSVGFNTSTATDLAVGLSDAPVAEGEAFAIDDNAVAVGWASGFLAAPGKKLAFRTLPNSVIDDSSALATPIPSGEAKALSVARYVAGSGGWNGSFSSAVGAYRVSSTKTHAIFWEANSFGVPQTYKNLSSLLRVNVEGDVVPDDNSEALSVNSSLWCVGWSGPAKSSPLARAVFSRTPSRIWRDLNDPHYTRAPGWILLSAGAISEGNVVVGSGVFNGWVRGFILIPRVPGQ